jgi:hypothetical protein
MMESLFLNGWIRGVTTGQYNYISHGQNEKDNNALKNLPLIRWGKRIQKTQHIIASMVRVQNKSNPTDKKKRRNEIIK